MENRILPRMPQGTHQQGKHKAKYIYFCETFVRLIHFCQEGYIGLEPA